VSSRRGKIAALAVVGCAFALAPAAHAQGVDETCLLTLTKLDPGTTNTLYPDDSARYYTGAYAAVPGTEIRLVGGFPHARYMSFNVYDPALRPVDALADAELAPDPGSTNPFITGANRNATKRSYSARIVFTTPPAQRAPNTLYASGAGVFTYRIYVPDKGQDEFGGVGLPTAEVVQTLNEQCAANSVFTSDMGEHLAMVAVSHYWQKWSELSY